MIDLSNYKIILGSSSQRRKELLAGLDINFEVIVKSTDERYPEHYPIEKVSEYIAIKKSQQFFPTGNEIVITADTVVILDNKILSKPINKADAFNILSKLSGKIHKVISGVCIKNENKSIVFSDVTEVSFKHISQEDIIYYIDKYQPFDKAGAYGVQEWFGYIAIDKIRGSYYNVMGFPVNKVYQNLHLFIL